MSEVLIPITMFVCILAGVGLVMYYRFRTRQELQLTLRQAMSDGQNMSSEVIDELMAAMQPKRNDLKKGIILISIGLATLVFAYFMGDFTDELSSPMVGLSAFPFFVGIAYLLLWRCSEHS